MNRNKALFLAIVMLAAVLTFAMLARPYVPTSESCTYMRVAQSITSGNGIIGM